MVWAWQSTPELITVTSLVYVLTALAVAITQSINQLRSVFDKARFDCGEIKSSIELENLKLEEVKQLARQVLGKEYAYFAEKLAAVTRDCPLFTVIGGRLLAEKQVAPQLLERDQDFQDYLLTKFQYLIIGQISNEIEPEKRLPRSIIQLLLKRIERDEEDKEGSYQPLPYLEFQHKLDGIAKSNEYKDILREIRNQALKRTYHTKFWYPKLFKEASLVPVSRGSDELHRSIQKTSPTPYYYEDEVLVFSPTSLEVLNEWIDSGDRQKIETASCLVSDAPKAFVFTNVEFVANLLEQAYELGDDCYQTVTYDLFNSATSGVRGGTPGQPFPEDIALQEKSAAVAAQFIVRSPSHRFYDSLAKDAKSSIQFWEKRWEEEFDSL
jgi:hypothetical protein